MILTVIVIPFLYLSSCSSVKEIIAIDYTYDLPRTTFSYPPVLYKSGEQILYAGQYYLNLDSILHVNGFSSGVVGPTYYTSCSITITTPPDGNFSWLQSARIEISKLSTFDTVQEIGYITDIDPSVKTIALTMNRTNIRPYLTDKFFYFRLIGILKIKQPATSAQMYIDGRLVMRLQPLN